MSSIGALSVNISTCMIYHQKLVPPRGSHGAYTGRIKNFSHWVWQNHSSKLWVNIWSFTSTQSSMNTRGTKNLSFWFFEKTRKPDIFSKADLFLGLSPYFDRGHRTRNDFSIAPDLRLSKYTKNESISSKLSLENLGLGASMKLFDTGYMYQHAA